MTNYIRLDNRTSGHRLRRGVVGACTLPFGGVGDRHHRRGDTLAYVSRSRALEQGPMGAVRFSPGPGW